MESSYLHTASVPLWTKGLLSSFHPWSTPHWSSSWMPWLPGYLMMIAWNGRTQNLCLWPPYIHLLRTMRSHTLQSDWSARHSPSQWWLWVLDITMYHCAHQHGLVGAEGGHDTTFSPLTPLCVWFWAVVIQGHGVSSLNISWAGEVPVGISLIVRCLLAEPSDALSNCWARPVA